MGPCLQSSYTQSKEEKAKRRVRYEEYTPFGQKVTQGIYQQTGRFVQFKVVDYNIMAQTNMMTFRRRYKHCPAECFQWGFRSEVLRQELLTESPDIACLQEVENCETLFKHFKCDGYDVLYVPRGADRPDGCAIMYRSTKFRAVDFRPVNYMHVEVPGGILDCPNVGMVLKLEVRDYPGHYVVVANTHLVFNIQRDLTRLSQLQILLAEIERMAYWGPEKYYPVILAGDLNSTSYSAVYTLLSKGHVGCWDMFPPEFTDPIWELWFHIGQLREYLDITQDCQYADVVIGRELGLDDPRRTQNLEELLDNHRVCPEINPDQSGSMLLSTTSSNSSSRSSSSSSHLEELFDNRVFPEFSQIVGIVQWKTLNDLMAESWPSRWSWQFYQHGWWTTHLSHSFRFLDVYQHSITGNSRQKNKRKGKDYICFSVGSGYEKLKLISRLRLPTMSEFRATFSSLPNQVCGSDHLPLTATFVLYIRELCAQ